MQLQVLGALKAEMQNVTVSNTKMSRKINLIHEKLSNDEIKKLPSDMQSICAGFPVHPVQVTQIGI